MELLLDTIKEEHLFRLEDANIELHWIKMIQISLMRRR